MSFRFDPIDFDEFHQVELPARLAAGNGAIAEPDVQRRRARSRSGCPTAARTRMSRSPRHVDVRAGDADAATVVELDEATWSDFAYELQTCFGLLYAGALKFPRGGFEGLLRWEPAIRSMFDGSPAVRPATLSPASTSTRPSRSTTPTRSCVRTSTEPASSTSAVSSPQRRSPGCASEVERLAAVADPGRRPVVVGDARRRHHRCAAG